jgi:molybdopterin synthase catalytic subunit/molybdopterin synthase sulfur carrier subunit
MKILFFAQLREATGVAVAEIDAHGVDSLSLWAILLERWPALDAHRANTRLARNGAYAGEADIFGAGDEVALIPPVSGG